MNADWTRPRDILDDAVRRGVFPSATLLVGAGDDVVHECYVGRPFAEHDELADAGTVYDLSSLTKPLATVALAVRLHARGALDFAEPVADLLPEFAADDPARRAVTVAHLLRHNSGLPGHRRYFDSSGAAGTPAGADAIAHRAAGEPLERSPGSTAVYSDVGFIVLGSLVEVVGHKRLHELFSEEIAVPLGLASTGFVDLDATPPSFAARAAPCGTCPWRGRRIVGEVQDENAWAMGGVAGHAGLFSTAREVHRVVAELVRAWLGDAALFSADVVREIWQRDEATHGSTWATGWDTPMPGQSSAGRLIGEPAMGHLGFTGTSVWIDLQRRVHIVLLTNRLEAGRDNTAIRALRPVLHDAVFTTIDAAGYR